MATLSLHSLFELRSCIFNGSVLLDMRANTIEEIAGDDDKDVVNRLRKNSSFDSLRLREHLVFPASFGPM